MMQPFNDHRMEVMMGRLLQAGVLFASFVVLTGGFLYLRANAGHAADFHTFTSEPADLRQVTQLMHLFIHGNPAAVIQTGILLLIATPIARVLFAVVGFAIERDRLYVVVSLIVFAVLMFSFFH